MTRQGTPEDYDNYPFLCRAIMEAFQASGHEDWLIMVATSINREKLEQGYNMTALADHIDWFNMM